MNELLNLLRDITPDQRAQFSHELHVVRQVCLAETIYQGAPRAHLSDRQKAADFLERYLNQLKLENAAEAKVEEQHELIKELIDLAGKGDELLEFIRTEYQPKMHSFFSSEPAIAPAVKEVRRKFKELIGPNASRQQARALVAKLNQNGLFHLEEVSEKLLGSGNPVYCVVLIPAGEKETSSLLIKMSYTSPKSETEGDGGYPAIWDEETWVLNLSVGTHELLEENHIKYVGDLVQSDYHRIANIRGFGSVKLKELMFAMKERDLDFNTRTYDWVNPDKR